MTLTELFVIYKERIIKAKKIILCHWSTQEGFEINNIDEFETILHQFGNDEVYLINEIQNDKMFFFEYFVMSKVNPYVIVLKHPLLTNSYWKDLPDKMIDSFVSEENNVYRYLMVDYGKTIKEFIVEFPPNIDFEILTFCKSKMKRGFLTKNNKGNSNISVLFTNSSRFVDLDASNFITYELQSLYDDWDNKKITTLNLSKKLWNDIKKIGQSTNVI